ncbi:Ubiquilin-1 [Binucleata daphniae]
MLHITFETKNHQIEYDPMISIAELKKIISQLINIPIQKIQIFYNEVLLNGESEPLSFFFPDESNITVKKIDDKKSTHPFSNFLKDENNMESMLNMFPELKDKVKDNKQLKEMVQSGYLQEEMEKMMNNPAYMKEQLKNADLAMSKLDNIPGGMDMMNSMIKDVRDPLESVLHKKVSDYKTGEIRKEIISNPIATQQEHVNYFIKYVQQLSELRVYGFKDVVKNVEALIKNNGDVEEAMNFLVQNSENRT